jgi:hypothetical protein
MNAAAKSVPANFARQQCNQTSGSLKPAFAGFVAERSEAVQAWF